MVPYYVTCPWCRAVYSQPRQTNCNNCGGTLPVQEAHGHPPPPAPRFLPKSYVRRVKYSGNVLTMIGVFFTVPFFWTIIFPIIGIFLWRKGLAEAREELLPLEHGAPSEGVITQVSIDYSKNMNGKHPRVVEFVFTAQGRKFGGSVPNVMDSVEHWMQPGMPVWVVYMQDNPDISSLWPPLK